MHTNLSFVFKKRLSLSLGYRMRRRELSLSFWQGPILVCSAPPSTWVRCPPNPQSCGNLWLSSGLLDGRRSLPSSCESNNAWDCSHIPPYVFMSLCSAKQWHALTLPFDESFSDNKLFYCLFAYCKGYIKSDPMTAWIVIDSTQLLADSLDSYRHCHHRTKLLADSPSVLRVSPIPVLCVRNSLRWTKCFETYRVKVALWSWNRLSLWQKWAPGISPWVGGGL